MIKMKELGVATVVALLVAGTLATGASVGTPVAVDSMADQQPDQALYEIERIGEKIKGSVNDSAEWNYQLSRERMQEFNQMAQKGKAENYLSLVNSARNQLKSAIQKSDNEGGLERAREVVTYHQQVLEQVRENVSLEAQEGLDTAIQSSKSVLGALDNATENIKEQAQEGLEEDIPVGGKP